MQRHPLTRYAPPLLLVASCAGGCPQPTRLAGEPQPPDEGYDPAIALDPDTVDFGPTPIGAEAVEEVEICNVGGGTLEVLGIEADVGEAFSARALGAGTVEPAQCTSFEAVFAPVGVGVAEDTLWVESNDPVNAFSGVALSGEGVGGD
jgi:hypothetical protein